jgi:hypothetical protein
VNRPLQAAPVRYARHPLAIAFSGEAGPAFFLFCFGVLSHMAPRLLRGACELSPEMGGQSSTMGAQPCDGVPAAGASTIRD